MMLPRVRQRLRVDALVHWRIGAFAHSRIDWFAWCGLGCYTAGGFLKALVHCSLNGG